MAHIPHPSTSPVIALRACYHVLTVRDHARHFLRFETMLDCAESLSFPGRLAAGAAQRSATCAVVGNGGGLLGMAAGSEIDKHDIVIRFNGGPVNGFQRYVGSKTTFRCASPRPTPPLSHPAGGA